MLYLCIDVGDRRTGLAVGDDETGVVDPVAVIAVPREGDLMDALHKAVEDYRPDVLVIGLPLNMDGTVGARAEMVRRFGEDLAERCGLPVAFQDERLTTFAADQQMAGSDRTHRQKKALRDALAAAEILRDHLEERRR